MQKSATAARELPGLAEADAPAVEDVAAAVYVIPTDAPEADGTLAWDKTTMVLVTVRAGGEQGIGWSYAAAAASAVVTDVLAGSVVGRSALDIAGATEAMSRAVRNIGRGGVAATAISAVDIALWDLKARLLGLPVTALLGEGRPAARSRLWKRRVHHLRRAADPRSALGLGREGPHPAGEDQDRRIVGRRRAAGHRTRDAGA